MGSVADSIYFMYMTPIVAGLFFVLVPALPQHRPTTSAAAMMTDAVRMEVAEVVHTEAGEFVVMLRSHGAAPQFLPIFMGEAEATSIRLRLDRREPPRPLTLNLLDDVLQEAHIQVTSISIDDCRDGIFLGTIHLRQQRHSWGLDARPSDAIGLAVRSRAPIWVRRSVLAAIAAPAARPEAAAEPAAIAAPSFEDTL